eukprot:6844756-Pyramimonas_sp.AAC.1
MYISHVIVPEQPAYSLLCSPGELPRCVPFWLPHRGSADARPGNSVPHGEEESAYASAQVPSKVDEEWYR